MLHIRTMTIEDLPLGMRLKDQAGWNQTEADWRRILALQPDGCFVAELEGRPAGTTATCVFDSIGWLAMILVDEAVRGRGIGTRLVEHALCYLDRCGVRTARLDATPLGRPLYARLGFVAEYELARLEGTAEERRGTASLEAVAHGGGESTAPVEAVAHGVSVAAAEQIDAVCALDRSATGTDRRRLIERLCVERPDAMYVSCAGRKIMGYLLLRAGSRATQVGPAVALSAEAGRALGDAALERCAAGLVFIDVPVHNTAAVRWAESSGLSVQRLLTRMYRGEPVRDQPARLWAGFGPEKG